MVRLQMGRRVDLIEPVFELRVLDGDLLTPVTNVLNQISVLVEKGMDCLGVLKVLGDVRGRVNLKPGWERGLFLAERESRRADWPRPRTIYRLRKSRCAGP
jgi:hypothetical protein